MERKTMSIEGMKTQACCGRVADALNRLDGVTAVADLERGIASITVEGRVSDQALEQAVVDAGYRVMGLKNS